MLILALAAPQDIQISTPVREAIAARKTTGDAVMIAKVQALADQDDASAIEFLGEIYGEGGFGVAADPARACALFARVAARRGESAHNLARCYEEGVGIARDPVKARDWYRKAAALGYVRSNCALGNMMVGGKGGPRDVAGGVALCRKAAEAGNADAQTDLGNFLLQGVNGKPDAVEARKWYALAAAQGQANAQVVLGQIYWNGNGTPVDRDAAVKWWKLAWDGGRKDAAALIVRDLFARLITKRDGKEVIDRTYLPDTITWLELAAAEDPDPEKRKGFAESLAILRGQQ